MERDKLQGLLGICMKAGKLKVGADQVVKAIREHKQTALVLTASDASENTVKRVSNCCSFYGIAYDTLPYDCARLGAIIGKSGCVAAIGISDRDLASAVLMSKKG